MRCYFYSLMLLCAFPVHAGVVFDQPHTGTGGLLSSSWWSPNGSDYDQYVWDSFTVAADVPITEVKWRGGGGAVTGFVIKFYSSIGGNSQPDLGSTFAPNPLATFNVAGNAGETAAGTFGGVPLKDYDAVLPAPFQAKAGTTYWIQIEATQTGIPNWGLATGTGNGTHFLQMAWIGDLYFLFGAGDAAFTLLTSDATIYSVAASASPTAGGTIAGAGLYPTGSKATLTAAPAANYAFVNWTENGTPVSTAANYSFTVTSARTLVANFTPGSAITTTSSPASGGTTTGAGTYANGASVTVTAAANANYSFVNWTENGVAVSTSPSYTFTAATNRALVANFANSVVSLVQVFSQPIDGTSNLIPSSFYSPDGLDGDGYAFDSFTLATAQDIYSIQWRGGYRYGNSAGSPVVNFRIKIYSSITGGSQPDVGSTLAPNPLKTYTVGDNASETSAGMVGGVPMFDYHYTLPASFHANAGTTYWVQIEAWQTVAFNDWGIAIGTGGNGTHYQQTTGAGTYITAGDVAFTLLAPAPPPPPVAATIVTSARPAVGGTTSGDGGYAAAAPVTVSAVANPGFIFVSWSENGAVVSTSANYQFTAGTDRTLAANFDPAFSLSLTSSSAAAGSVSGSGSYSALAGVSAVATPNPGYNFVNWTEGGTVVSTAASYGFTLTADRTLTANFALTPVSVIAGNPAPGSCTFHWSAATPGWVLQESPDLSPGSWTTSTQTVNVNGSDSSITISSPTGSKFFRLYHP